ncbi:MAG: acyl carrier protein [Oscillospiraceae bacterium]|nr:acyl carrier protein [Oscillospiraceae bacterium]
MDEIIAILSSLHPEIDAASCEELADGGVIDSFDIVSIIAEVRERFDVTLTAAHILPEHFNSARALWALVEGLMD